MPKIGAPVKCSARAQTRGSFEAVNDIPIRPGQSDEGVTAKDFAGRLKTFTVEFDRRFDRLLKPAGEVPPELLEAMRYTALLPGKRLRPYLVTRCCELVGGDRSDTWHVGAAIECVHAFSLIHDDLPAMDDDDLRRGRPSSHKQFGEALAILAGDALATLAFELLVRHSPNEQTAARTVLALADGAGWSGMIGGQTADVLGEAKPPSLALATYIHERKTASLFETACKLGAIVGGAEESAIAVLGRFGKLLGRAFQVADDLLDLTSTTDAMGKRVGKDAAAGKQTFPRCVGTKRSEEAARTCAEQAVAHLAPFDSEANDLRALANYVVDRNY